MLVLWSIQAWVWLCFWPSHIRHTYPGKLKLHAIINTLRGKTVIPLEYWASQMNCRTYEYAFEKLQSLSPCCWGYARPGILPWKHCVSVRNRNRNRMDNREIMFFMTRTNPALANPDPQPFNKKSVSMKQPEVAQRGSAGVSWLGNAVSAFFRARWDPCRLEFWVLCSFGVSSLVWRERWNKQWYSLYQINPEIVVHAFRSTYMEGFQAPE